MSYTTRICYDSSKRIEAHIVPRSSTFKNFKIVQSNSLGIIDNTYSGNDDEWKFPAISLERTVIKKGDRICQFRIQLSQKATIWQKLSGYLLLKSSLNGLII